MQPLAAGIKGMTPRKGALAVLLVAVLGGCGGDDSRDDRAGAGQTSVEGPAYGAPARDGAGTESGADEAPAAKPEDARDEAARVPRGGERRRSGRPSSRRAPQSRREGSARSRRDSASRRITRAQAVAAADDVCTDFRREVAALPDEGRSFGALARRTAALRRLTERVVTQLRSVRAPRERRSSLRNYIRSIEAQLPVLEALQGAAEREDRDGISDAYGRIQILGDTAKRFARRYGLGVCGSG